LYEGVQKSLSAETALTGSVRNSLICSKMLYGELIIIKKFDLIKALKAISGKMAS